MIAEHVVAVAIEMLAARCAVPPPVISTISQPSTLLVVMPYFRQCTPPEFSAMFAADRRQAILRGRVRARSRSPRAAPPPARSPDLVTPGSTTTTRFFVIDHRRTRLNLPIPSSTPSASGKRRRPRKARSPRRATERHGCHSRDSSAAQPTPARSTPAATTTERKLLVGGSARRTRKGAFRAPCEITPSPGTIAFERGPRSSARRASTAEFGVSGIVSDIGTSGAWLPAVIARFALGRGEGAGFTSAPRM